MNYYEVRSYSNGDGGSYVILLAATSPTEALELSRLHDYYGADWPYGVRRVSPVDDEAARAIDMTMRLQKRAKEEA